MPVAAAAAERDGVGGLAAAPVALDEPVSSTRTDRMLKFLGGLLLVLIIVAIGGYALGWFTWDARAAENGGGVVIGVNRDKIDRDTGRVSDAVRDIAEETGEEVEQLGAEIEQRLTESDEVVRGTVARVDPVARQLVVTLPSGERSFDLGPTTDIHRAGHAAQLADLQPGDRVAVAIDGAAVDLVVVQVD